MRTLISIIKFLPIRWLDCFRNPIINSFRVKTKTKEIFIAQNIIILSLYIERARKPRISFQLSTCSAKFDRRRVLERTGSDIHIYFCILLHPWHFYSQIKSMLFTSSEISVRHPAEDGWVPSAMLEEKRKSMLDNYHSRSMKVTRASRGALYIHT